MMIMMTKINEGLGSLRLHVAVLHFIGNIHGDRVTIYYDALLFLGSPPLTSLSEGPGKLD